MTRRRGRPKKVLAAAQWRTVHRMARALCTAQEVADYLGCSKSTLYSPDNGPRFQAAMAARAAGTKLRVRERQIRDAIKGNGPIGHIWWGKQHLGQTDRQAVTGAGGGPIEIVNQAQAALGDALLAAVKKLQPTGEP